MKLPSWGVQLGPLAGRVGSHGEVERVTDPHLSIQRLPTTWCVKLCFNCKSLRESLGYVSLKRTRLCLYQEALISAELRLFRCGLLGRRAHILVRNPHLRCVRSPRNFSVPVLGSFMSTGHRGIWEEGISAEKVWAGGSQACSVFFPSVTAVEGPAHCVWAQLSPGADVLRKKAG